MQFIKDGSVYKAIKVSGPKHNMLGLTFSKKLVDDINIVVLPDKSNITEIIEPNKVKEEVIAGVTEANLELNVNYIIEQIEIVSSDTPSPGIYKELAMGIIHWVNSSDQLTD